MFKTIIVTAVLLTLAPAVMAADTPDTSTWVQFNSFTYTGKVTAAPGAEEYLNPIVAGFYPYPSICRIGDDQQQSFLPFNDK